MHRCADKTNRGTWLCTFAALIIAGLGGSLPAHARLLQIIHTNDLHSYFEHSGEDTTRGGYPALKAQIDVIKARAQSSGIDVLVVDAGDFGDGSPLYFADKGEQSWNLMNAIGYDAVALGNHDYLPGQIDLDRIIGNVNPNFALLAANFKPDAKQKNLRKFIWPVLEVERAGIRLAILGLTNTEWSYRWRVGPHALKSARDTLNGWMPTLRGRNDFVFALTHLGLRNDLNLVQKTEGVDLLIGGHSHDFLRTPVMIQNLNGQKTPIVQAGRHGEVIGDLLVDLQPGKPLMIVHYRLVPVLAKGPRDTVVEKKVQQAREAMNTQYGEDWLAAPLGETTVELRGPKSKFCRSGTDLIVESMRIASGTQAAIDNEEFYGAPIKPGPITREAIMGLYPRIYSFKNTMGWTVWTAEVRGVALQYLMNMVLSAGYVPNVAGLTYEIRPKGAKHEVFNVRVAGKPLEATRVYTVAMPEGMALWARDATWMVEHLVTANLRDTGTPVWLAVEVALKKLGVIRKTRVSPGATEIPAMPGCDPLIDN